MADAPENVFVPEMPASSVASTPPNAREDFKMLAYWISLGAAAGGLGGALVGGVGGRLAMLLLRLTSDASVRGLESDDGFTIGQFSVLDTAQLVLATAVMGAVAGLLVVAGRPFFPQRGMPWAWAAVGALAGGGIFINKDGVDFTALEPHWLAVALFIALPAAGAFAIAWLAGQYPRFWWRNRPATAVAGVAAIPCLVFFPVAIMAIIVGGLWLLALRVAGAHEFARWRPARVAALVVFALVAGLGAIDLTHDTRAIL
jgi:hypothetical protein